MHSTPSGRLLGRGPVRASFKLALVSFLILGALTTLWSLATPLMTVPDEPAHAIKAAAVARGQFQAQSSGKQGDPLIVQVPAYFADLGAQTCTAFKNNVTADCAPTIDGSNRQLTTAPTTAGNYNPFYYLVVGLPSRLLTGAPAVYTMRIIGGLFTAFFLSMSFMAARRMEHKQWPIIASTVALTPMSLYLAGSINPNSLEVATTAAFFLNLCVVFENFRSLSSVRAPLLAVGLAGFALANTRALSLIWLALAFTAALIVYGWKPLLAVVHDKLGIAVTALTVIGCAAGLAWLVFADSFKSLGGIPSTITPDQAFVTMLDRTFDYVSGFIGLMGWIDTLAPSGVLIFWHFAFAALLVAGFTARPLRNRWALVVLILGVVLLPPVMQSQVIQDLGYIWQGRYLLALVVLLLLSSGVALSREPFTSSRSSRTVSRLLLGGAVVAHAYAFLYLLRRYTVGLLPLHTNWSEMGEAAWQPPLSWQVLTISYVLVLTLGSVLVQRSIFPPVADQFREAAGSRRSSHRSEARPESVGHSQEPVGHPDGGPERIVLNKVEKDRRSGTQVLGEGKHGHAT